MNNLSAIVYDNSLSSPAYQNRYRNNVSDIRILWELHGGLQKIELSIGLNYNDSYFFYNNYLGYRLVIVDDNVDIPVADGFITAISITGKGVRVTANGFWFRHFDQSYNFDDTAQDTNQGNISYTLQGASSTFTDDAQVWSDWAGSGNAKYEIEVTHKDGSTSTGFLGPTVSTTEIYVYNTYGLDTTGWLTRSTTAIVDDEQGTISYSMSTSGGSKNHVTFIDTGQDWNDWKTSAGNAAYKIVVTNENNTESWACLGATVSTTEIFVYEDLARTDDGFNDGIRMKEDVVTANTTGDYFEIDGSFKENLRVGDTFYIKGSTGNDATYTVGVSSFVSGKTRLTVDTSAGESVSDSTADGNLEWFEGTASTYNVLSLDDQGGTPSSYEVVKCYDYKTTSDIIKDAINTEVTALEYDSSGIEETNTVIGFWEPPITEGGMYPGELIEKLASVSDSSNRQWNYYVQEQPFDMTVPQKPKPIFEPQVDDGTYNWEIKKWMIKGGTTERNIQEMRNAVRIIYRDMDNNNVVTLEPTADSSGNAQWNSDSDSISNYWRREIYLSGGDSTSSIAGQYSNLFLNKYKDSMAKKSIDVSAPYIIGDNQARWPLWAPLKYSQSWFRLTDLFPEMDILDSSWDRKFTFQAITMEYSSSDGGSLRLHFDTEDDSLAALLARVQAFR